MPRSSITKPGPRRIGDSAAAIGDQPGAAGEEFMAKPLGSARLKSRDAARGGTLGAVPRAHPHHDRAASRHIRPALRPRPRSQPAWVMSSSSPGVDQNAPGMIVQPQAKAPERAAAGARPDDVRADRFAMRPGRLPRSRHRRGSAAQPFNPLPSAPIRDLRREGYSLFAIAVYDIFG
jgi:hypothetical protein